MNIVMNIKQKLLIFALITASVAVGSLLHSDRAYAAVAKDKFIDLTCAHVNENKADAIRKCKDGAKGKANNVLKIGKYKYSDWKSAKVSELKQAFKLGAATPKELAEKKEEEKNNGGEEESEGSGAPEGCDQTTIIKVDCSEGGESAIWSIIIIVINVLSAGVIVAAIGGFVYASILYASAGDNAGQVSSAKGIITNIVIGIVCYALMYGFLQFLIPGGIFS